MVIPSQSYIFFFFVSLIFHTLASPTLQRDALLEFKSEFAFAARDALSSWNTSSSDHCSWKGVECNGVSDEVKSLDLDTISLNGSLKSNTSLFKLQHLQNLTLTGCNLTGEIPSSLGNLSHLTDLDLSDNHLVGEIPHSVGNLNQLEYLKFSFNSLSGNIPTSFGNLTNLKFLFLHQNQFTSGDFSRILANLTNLIDLDLDHNHIKSKLPSDMRGVPNLEAFVANGNSFFGNPTSLFTMGGLMYVDLGGNQLEGPLDFGNGSSSSSFLYYIDLSHNNFKEPVHESIYGGPDILYLDLSHNSFTKFASPSSSKLPLITYLDLSYNKLEGQVPSFLWRVPMLKLSHNSFSSLDRPVEISVDGCYYDLSFNSLQGTFPQWTCKFKNLEILDLSNNHLNGSIPSCLKNTTSILNVLNLRNNSFSGILPDICIRTLDVSHNKLVGKLPRSLINCRRLEFLNVKGNKISDTFPSWLQSLKSLRVLLLGSNAFYGPIYTSSVSLGFPTLRVIDLSHNSFNGTLPQDYFANWLEMSLVWKNETGRSDEEKTGNMAYRFGILATDEFYESSMDMMYKGVETEFPRIFLGYKAIDLSGNKFKGRIPASVGMLKELRLLNLSGNAFTGDIPSSLANITNLEALDLSSNKLSGSIPPDLGKLSFMSYMDFSHNFLEGPVPRSTQFQSQKCSSFEDNLGLSGLDVICGDIHVPDATSQEHEEIPSEQEEVFSWIAAAIAYVPGVFCGLVIGHIFFTSHKHEWFMEKFGRNKPRGITSVR